jgi:hypothetical protein
MKVTYRTVTTTLTAALVGMLLVPAASACALSDQPTPSARLQLMQDSPGVGFVCESRSRTEQPGEWKEPVDRGNVEFSIYFHG